MKYLLGIDVGTSGTKTVLFDLNGNSVASYTGEYPLSQPKNGWAEQSPLDWWNAVAEGIRAVISKVGRLASEDVAVGLSGQMHGLVMLDKRGEVLRPSMIWCDQRTGAEAEEIEAAVGRERLLTVTANPAMTGFTAAKIRWVQKYQPEIYSKCAHIMLPKDFIRYKLTGEFATDVSDASGMQLMDIGKRSWSDEILSALDIDRAMLCSMHESRELSGKVNNTAAELTGLAAGTPVVAGAGDNAAAAIGTGTVKSRSGFNTIGSSAVIYALSDRLCIDKQGRVHGLCASVPGKWTVMSCTQAAGLSLKWLKETIGSRSYREMDDLARSVSVGADGLIYLPYLMGERSPHPDPDCRGVFFGLSARHGQPQLIRAVLEGVAYSQRECLDVFAQMGAEVDKLLLCGGGAASPLWRQIFADVYRRPVYTLKTDEGAALGAALLAGVGGGAYSSEEEACAAAVAYEAPTNPSESCETYDGYYTLYKKLYPILKGSWKELTSVQK